MLFLVLEFVEGELGEGFAGGGVALAGGGVGGLVDGFLVEEDEVEGLLEAPELFRGLLIEVLHEGEGFGFENSHGGRAEVGGAGGGELGDFLGEVGQVDEFAEENVAAIEGAEVFFGGFDAEFIPGELNGGWIGVGLDVAEEFGVLFGGEVASN